MFDPLTAYRIFSCIFVFRVRLSCGQSKLLTYLLTYLCLLSLSAVVLVYTRSSQFVCNSSLATCKSLKVVREVLRCTPLAGSRVVRIDSLRFLAGCRKRRLNQALSVLSLSLGFF